MTQPVLQPHDLGPLFPALYQHVNGLPLVYLDNAATTHKPQSVIEAVSQYYRENNANVHRGAHALSARATADYERARDTVRHFLNARHRNEIIWTRGATEAINLLAYSWGGQHLSKGDEILLTRMEHHANIVPWQLVAERTGAVVKVINILPSGVLDIASFRRELSPKTRMLAVTQTSNVTGIINPVKTLIDEAHSVGACVLIDGAQAVAHQPVDVQALNCDFYTFSGHKAFGPTGIGVLYGKKALLDAMPPWQGGGEMIRHVSFEQTIFNHLPHKFEAGTPNIASAIGLAEALSFIRRLDGKALKDHETQLRQRMVDGLSSINSIRLVGALPHGAPVISFISEHLHPQDMGTLLDQQGVAVRVGHHCAMPYMAALGVSGTVRASIAGYNTVNDVDVFLASLSAVHDKNTVILPVTDTEANDINYLFNHMPFGKIITQKDINSTLLPLSHWQARYREIIRLGKSLPPLSRHLKTEEALLQGCESPVWFHYRFDEDSRQWQFIADSDARIIKGLIALVLIAFNHKTSQEIQAFDIDYWFKQLGLTQHLSPSRSSGLQAIITSIQSVIPS